MIVAILGFPGRFTEFCRDVCLDILRETGREPFLLELVYPGSDVTEMTPLAQIAAAAMRPEGELILAVSRAPDDELLRALTMSGQPYFVMIDDPRRIVLSQVSQNLDVVSAIRHVTACSAALSDIGSAANAKVFLRDEFASKSHDFSIAVRSALRLPSDSKVSDLVSSAIEKYAAGLQASTDIEKPVQEALQEALTPSDALAVKGCLTGFHAGFRSKTLGQIIVTRALFYTNESVDHQVAPSIDITGRDRCLIFGPFLFLPKGKWTLRMTLAFSTEAVGTSFVADVVTPRNGSLKELGQVNFIAIAGRYIVQLTFLHTEPNASLEFRILLKTPAFDGKLSLGYAELERTNHSELEKDREIEWNGQ